MAFTVFPKHGDTLTEAAFAALVESVLGGNVVVSGFGWVSSSGLTVTIGPGVAVVKGRQVVSDANASLTLPANSTVVVYLALSLDASGNVTGASLASTTGTVPDTGIALWRVVTGASAVSRRSDLRLFVAPSTRFDPWSPVSDASLWYVIAM